MKSRTYLNGSVAAIASKQKARKRKKGKNKNNGIMSESHACAHQVNVNAGLVV